MKKFLKMFVDSAKEFKSINSIAVTGLLLALRTVLAVFLSFQVTPSLRISVSFIANVIIGALYGPVVGFVAGAAGDLIQFVIRPTGAFFPGWTLSAALSGLIFGVFFYKRFPKKPFDIKYILLVSLVIVIENLFVNIFLGTCWCVIMLGKAFDVFFVSRLMKNLLQMPINIFLSYVLLALVKKVKNK